MSKMAPSNQRDPSERDSPRLGVVNLRTLRAHSLARWQLGCALGLGAAMISVACGPADDRPGPPPQLRGQGGDGGTGSSSAGPACEDGASRECWEEIGQNGDVLSCFHGTQTCLGGVWGPCEADGIVSRKLPAPADGARPMSLSEPCECTNPCDPSCQVWNEDPAGVTTPAASTTALQGGAMSALPGGHVDKLLQEPCDGPEDCMCDHYCDVGSGYCEPYLPGSFNACGGPDLTMPVPCDGHVWVCNRGDQAAPAGLAVAIINGNSNQLQNSVGQCSGLDGTLDKTCGATTEPIDPGGCIDVAPLCGGLPNGTKHVVVNSGDYPPTVGECDCGQNHCAMKNQATNACASISAYSQLVHREIYEASCPSGHSVQWNYLAYSASTSANASGSSSVTIQAHTAATVAGLSPTCADCVTLADVPATEPETCSMGGPAPCPINLYDELGPPAARQPVLELELTLDPTPDAQVAPDVTAWEISYSCVADE